MSTNINLKRISKDMRDLEEEPIDGVHATPKSDGDIRFWHGYIQGADDTPYKDGKFSFEVEFSDDFPFKPPKFNFTTSIYHPGINKQGQVCLAILREGWKPAMSFKSVLLEIQDKLNHPKADDPFEPEIAQLLKEHPTKFSDTAAEWTRKYAKDSKIECP